MVRHMLLVAEAELAEEQQAAQHTLLAAETELAGQLAAAWQSAASQRQKVTADNGNWNNRYLFLV